MSENRILVIVIPPRRNSEEQSIPRAVSEREPASPAEIREPDEIDTPVKERWTRPGCEPMNNTPPRRRL
jgi:hypothetical protein